MQRVFVNKENDKFILNENDLYHLRKVLRIKNKDLIECVYENSIYLCEWNENGDDYNLVIKSVDSSSPELPSSIHLYQALIRNENYELVLQKATELGVSFIYPTIFKRNVVIIEDKKIESKLERFNKITSSAAMQSHRLFIPQVLKPINVNDICLESGEIGLVCYEKEKNVKSLKDIENVIKEAKTIKIVIGPEGGFEVKEYENLLNKGFISVSLGKRILRSETAAFNILSKLDYILEKE